MAEEACGSVPVPSACLPEPAAAPAAAPAADCAYADVPTRAAQSTWWSGPSFPQVPSTDTGSTQHAETLKLHTAPAWQLHSFCSFSPSSGHLSASFDSRFTTPSSSSFDLPDPSVQAPNPQPEPARPSTTPHDTAFPRPQPSAPANAPSQTKIEQPKPDNLKSPQEVKREGPKSSDEAKGEEAKAVVSDVKQEGQPQPAPQPLRVLPPHTGKPSDQKPEEQRDLVLTPLPAHSHPASSSKGPHRERVLRGSQNGKRDKKQHKGPIAAPRDTSEEDETAHSKAGGASAGQGSKKLDPSHSPRGPHSHQSTLLQNPDNQPAANMTILKNVGAFFAVCLLIVIFLMPSTTHGKQYHLLNSNQDPGTLFPLPVLQQFTGR